jgi:hypothetical protein
MGQRIQGKGFGKREGRIDLGYLVSFRGEICPIIDSSRV